MFSFFKFLFELQYFVKKKKKKKKLELYLNQNFLKI